MSVQWELYDIPGTADRALSHCLLRFRLQRNLSSSDLEQTSTHAPTLDISTLGVGGITQQVNVSGRGMQLDETTDTLGARTEPEQIKELPLNG